MTNIWSYLENVLRQSVLPTGSPLPSSGPVPVLMAIVGATVPVFAIVGAVVWYRRHPRAESWMVWAYFAETLAYPYNNQRRVVLVLPMVTIWYVAGAAAVGRALLALGGRTLSRVAASVAVVVAVLVAGVPTAVGFTRDYLFNVGQKSSEFAQSPAMDLLKAIGPDSAVVETDYRGSVAFFSDHRTAWSAFTATTPFGPFAWSVLNCSVPVVNGALRADSAQFLMVGDVNHPGVMDSPCLLHMATDPSTAAQIGAVRLLSTDHDQTSVFELVGAGTPQSHAVDWTARKAPTSRATAVLLAPNGQGDVGGIAYSVPAQRGTARYTWAWRTPVPLSQLSIGSVTSTGPVLRTTVSIELPDRAWRSVSVVAGAVGDYGVVPYALVDLPSGTEVIGFKVSVRTTGTAQIAYVNAIGTAGTVAPTPGPLSATR